MPMYIHACSDCDYRLEEICSMADGKKRLKIPCPKCGGRIIQPACENIPAIHLRGYSPAHPRFFRGMRGKK